MTLTLGALGLLSSKPWQTTSLAPSVAVAPGLGAALGESEAVEAAPAGGPGVAVAHVAGGVSPGFVAGPVVVSKSSGGGGSGPLLAVSRGRAVGHSGVGTVPPAPSEPPASPVPVAQPVAAAPEPTPATPPLVASSGSGSPGTSGVVIPGQEIEPPQSCAGDEYVFTVTPEAAGAVSEESQLDILVERFASDGSESELHLEGDLGDVRNLVSLLVSEGNCVQVKFVSPEGLPVSGDGIGVVELGDTPESALP